jgi:nucleoside-diphosphate-sugar epimerase
MSEIVSSIHSSHQYQWKLTRAFIVAQAHFLAYTKSEAANQRYIVTAGSYSYQQAVDIIRSKFPELKDKLPEGQAGAALPPIYELDTSKVRTQLGLTFRTKEETFVDTVNSLLELEKKVGA